jgi:hypothetical protein
MEYSRYSWRQRNRLARIRLGRRCNLYQHENRNIKRGHYLDQTEEMRAIRRDTLRLLRQTNSG